MRKKFTLIELLVVIAIIAILASMLLPALSKARMAAIVSKCVSNQKQVMLGVHMYSMDNQDSGPWGDATHGLGSDVQPRFWGVLVLPYLGGDVNSFAWGGMSSATEGGVLKCPGTGNTTTLLQGALYHSFACGAVTPRLTAIGNPSGRIYRVDSLPGYACFTYGQNPYYAADPVVTFNNHAGQRANVSLVDGHVETVSYGRLTYYEFYYQLGQTTD